MTNSNKATDPRLENELLAFLQDLGVEDIEHLLSHPLEDDVLAEVASLDAQAAMEEDLLKRAYSAGNPDDIAQARGRISDVAAQRPDVWLLQTAGQVRAMRLAMDPKAIALALASEAMPCCPTCRRRSPEMKSTNDFVKSLSALFGGECGACVADRLHAGSSSATAPVGVSTGHPAFGLNGSHATITSSLTVDRAAQGSRRPDIVVTESMDSESRALQAEETAFGAGSIRREQIAIREARWNVRMLGEGIRRFLAASAANAASVAAAATEMETMQKRATARAAVAKKSAAKIALAAAKAAAGPAKTKTATSGA